MLGFQDRARWEFEVVWEPQKLSLPVSLVKTFAEMPKATSNHFCLAIGLFLNIHFKLFFPSLHEKPNIAHSFKIL